MAHIKNPIGFYDPNPFETNWNIGRIFFSVSFLVFFSVIIFKYNDWIEGSLGKYLFLNHRTFYDKYFAVCEFFFIILLFYGLFRTIGD